MFLDCHTYCYHSLIVFCCLFVCLLSLEIDCYCNLNFPAWQWFLVSIFTLKNQALKIGTLLDFCYENLFPVFNFLGNSSMLKLGLFPKFSLKFCLVWTCWQIPNCIISINCFFGVQFGCNTSRENLTTYNIILTFRSFYGTMITSFQFSIFPGKFNAKTKLLSKV